MSACGGVVRSGIWAQIADAVHPPRQIQSSLTTIPVPQRLSGVPVISRSCMNRAASVPSVGIGSVLPLEKQTSEQPWHISTLLLRRVRNSNDAVWRGVVNWTERELVPRAKPLKDLCIRGGRSGLRELGVLRPQKKSLVNSERCGSVNTIGKHVDDCGIHIVWSACGKASMVA